MNDLPLQIIINQIDSLIFAQTGKHLDNLQYAILEGSLNNKKYKEIANKNCRSEKYVKEVGSKLWKILSQVLGEKIDKLNIKSTLYRYYNHVGLASNTIRTKDVVNHKVLSISIPLKK